MFKTFLLSISLLASFPVALAGNNTLKSFAVNDGNQIADSTFVGHWKGDWTAKAAPLASFSSDGESEHNGTWDISIASDGEVTGNEFDKTGGDKGSLKGFIDEDGYIKVFVKYEKTSTIKGVLEKKGARLTGNLKQSCTNDSSKICATIDIILKRQ